MTSSANHQYCLRYGLWHAPCHASAQLAGCTWSEELANSIPPIVVTPPCEVQSCSKRTLVVNGADTGIRQWIKSECPVEGVILPDVNSFLVSTATYLTLNLSVSETPPQPGDTVQVRFRPTFAKLASDEYCCNLLATDVRICRHAARRGA